MLKKLFYASASILMLALAYHLGAGTAQGQSGSMVTGFATAGGDGSGFVRGVFTVLTPNGDVYARQMEGGGGAVSTATPLVHLGNFWSGGPTPAAQQTWGQLKVQYRK